MKSDFVSLPSVTVNIVFAGTWIKNKYNFYIFTFLYINDNIDNNDKAVSPLPTPTNYEKNEK